MSYHPLNVLEEAEGQRLKEPHGLTIDKRNGNLLVSDTGNQRIIVFDESGKFIQQFGKKGDGPGEFSHPMDVAVGPDGSIYVSDYFQDRIQKFTSDGNYILEWGTPGEGKTQFNAPTGLAVDRAGNVYVADFYNSVIKVFSAEGQFLRTIGSAGQFGPGKLDYPTDVNVNTDGSVLVADTYNYRIQRFNLSGSSAWGWHLLWFFPRPGGATQGFKEPTGTTFGPNGVIHVADGGNHRVVTLDSSGAFMGDWPLPDIDLEKDAQTYNSPVAVAAKPDGTAIYVADIVNSRIIILGIEYEGYPLSKR
ncbi:MAG: NHL repeat-containing protein [Oleispira sp.]|nr:NHL repeat-containing protein [Oleispira sp.]MBL4880223.1 NHL repeat-containing protein [Oleispira sp.]